MFVGFIMTRDELSTLRKCIDSIYPLVDKIFVIDGGSVDGTIEYLNTIDKVISITYVWDYGDCRMCQNQRNRLLAFIDNYFDGVFNNLWVFMIDSDETLSDDAVKYLKSREFENNNNNFLGGFIARANLSGDGQIYVNNKKEVVNSQEDIDRNVSKYPDWQLRLFKYTGKERYDFAPHEIINTLTKYPKKIKYLPGYLRHQRGNDALNNHEYWLELQRRINGDSPKAFVHRNVFIFSPVYEGTNVASVISISNDINGWMNEAELTFLAEKACQSSTIIEVGAFQGRTTKLLAKVCKGKVYTVEPWFGNFYNATTCKWEWHSDIENAKDMFYNNLKDEVASGIVEVLQMTSQEAVKVLQEKNIKADMVFLDGDHTAPVIDHDIKEYLQFVRQGGIFCGHDAQRDFPDVWAALNKYLPGWVQTGSGQIWSRVR